MSDFKRTFQVANSESQWSGPERMHGNGVPVLFSQHKNSISIGLDGWGLEGQGRYMAEKAIEDQ